VAVGAEEGPPAPAPLPAGSDREAVAALVIPLVDHGRQLSHAAGTGRIETVVLELEGGPAIVSQVDQRHILIVLAEPARDIGLLLHEIRTERAAVSRAI